MITARRPADEDILLSRRLAGRIAAILFAVLAGVGNVPGIVLPGYPPATRPVLAVLCAVLIAIGLVLWYLPWERWPRRATLWIVPLAFTCADAFNLVVPINPYRYGIYPIALFAWLGVAHRRGLCLALAPLLVVVYLLPLKLTGLLTPSSAMGVMYLAFFCVLQGETLAWMVARLAETRWALRVSQDRYRALSENATDLVAIADCAGLYTYASPSFQTVLGYAPERDPYSAERITLLAELRQAIAHDGLVLHYQPKITFASGAICGAEALARWPHPTRGFIPPDQFVPLAEQTGQMGLLTRWALDAAVRQARLWHSQGLAIPIAVNLSAANLLDPQFYALVTDLLAAYDVPPSLLRLEVTESTLMADTGRALGVLTSLSRLGIGLSIDDFGTGYSSLAYLKELPADEIKIDRSFVQHVAEDESDAVIVASTIGLAHSLGRTVVAESVETERALSLLRDLKCDVAQGYYLSRPLPAEGFERWMRGRPPLATGNPSAA